jgi:hypothetical protein
MKSTALLALLAILTAANSSPVVAHDRKQDSQRDRRHVREKRTKGGF